MKGFLSIQTSSVSYTIVTSFTMSIMVSLLLSLLDDNHVSGSVWCSQCVAKEGSLLGDNHAKAKESKQDSGEEVS